MLLSDRQILRAIENKEIICEPFEPLNVQPSSLDLRLGAILLVPFEVDRRCPIMFDFDKTGKLKLKTEQSPIAMDISSGGYALYPNEFILAETLEYVGSASNRYAAQIADKSTLARVGLSVCFSAGWIDPGNVLNITLELKNNSNSPIVLNFGMHIAQIKFFEMSEPSERLYNGKYLNSRSVQGAL